METSTSQGRPNNLSQKNDKDCTEVEMPRRLNMSSSKNTSRTSSLAPSIGSSRTQETTEFSPNLRTKFTYPRMNLLTEQRLNRARLLSAEAENAASATMPRRRIGRSCSQTSIRAFMEWQPWPKPLMGVQRKLMEVQSECIRKIINYGDPMFSYKFVCIKIKDSCTLVLHPDEMRELPKYIPAASVNDLKTCCRQVLDYGSKLLCEKVQGVQFAQDYDAASLSRAELCSKLEAAMKNKMKEVDSEIDKVCIVARESEIYKLITEVKELSTVNQEQKSTITKLNANVATLSKSYDDLQSSLAIRSENLETSTAAVIQLNLKNAELNKSVGDLQREANDLQSSIGTLEKKLKDANDANAVKENIINDNANIIEQQSDQLAAHKIDLEYLKKRCAESTDSLAARDVLISKLKHEMQELKESPAYHQDHLKQISELLVELAVKTEQAAKSEEMRIKMIELLESLHVAELKATRLEQQVEDQDRMLAMKSERIKYLEVEVEDQQLQCKCKLSDVITYSNIQNSLIAELGNKLRLTVDDYSEIVSFQNDTTLNHDQALKKLEKQNARIVKKLASISERITLLQEECAGLQGTTGLLTNIVIDNGGRPLFDPGKE